MTVLPKHILHAGIGDLERALARIQASVAAEAEGANAAIYYEDTAKRKVLSLVTALRGLQSLQVCSWHPGTSDRRVL